MTTLTGTVVNGMVVFDGGQSLPDGTKVRVEAEARLEQTESEQPRGTLAWMLEFAGKVPDLPPDLAAQHDHYLYGTPKR